MIKIKSIKETEGMGRIKELIEALEDVDSKDYEAIDDNFSEMKKVTNETGLEIKTVKDLERDLADDPSYSYESPYYVAQDFLDFHGIETGHCVQTPYEQGESYCVYYISDLVDYCTKYEEENTQESE